MNVKDTIFSSVKKVNSSHKSKSDSSSKPKGSESEIDKMLEDDTYAIDYSEIKDKSSWKLRSDVLDWNNRDVALYISKLYRDRYDERWDVNIVAVVCYIPKVKQALVDSYGFSNNIILKHFVDYCFDNWVDYLKATTKDGIFYIQKLLNEEVLKDFVEHYNYKARLEEFKTKENEKKVDVISEEDLKSSLIIGMENVLMDYGFIVTANWLIMSEGYEPKLVLKRIASSMVKLYKSRNLQKVIDATSQYECYPDWFDFTNYGDFLAIISKRIKSEIKLKNKIKFQSNCDEWNKVKNIFE